MSLASTQPIVLRICVAVIAAAWTFSVGQTQPPAAPPAVAKPVVAPAAPAPVAVTPPVAANKFKEDAVDPDVEKLEKELIGKRKQVFLKPESWATVGTEIKGYYQRVYLPRMTQLASLTQLATLRSEFMRDVDKSTGPMRVDLLDVAFRWAGMVVQGVDYHPAVRINATFVLAELEEVRLVSSGPAAAPPIPYEKSLQALTFIVSNPTKVNDGMRAVAIYGLSRYIRLSQNQANRESAVNKLMGVIAETCPASRDGPAHAFMQGMALDGLMHYEKARSDPNMAKQLIKIANDHSQPSFLRVKAAEIIGGKMSKPKDLQPPISELDQNFKQLIAKVFEHEAVRLESLKKKPVLSASGADPGAMSNDYSMQTDRGSIDSSSMGMGMGMGMGMAAKPVAAPQPPDIIMSRRRVNWLLEGLHLGWDGRRVGEPMTGAKTGIASWDVKEPAQEAVASAVKLISDLQISMNDLTISKPEDYAVKLRREAAKLVPAKEGVAVEAAGNPSAGLPDPGLPGVDPTVPGVAPNPTEIPPANPLEAGAASGAG